MKQIYLALTTIIFSTSALAGLDCGSKIIKNEQIVATCVQFHVPSRGAIESTHNCNGYEVTINVDLHSRPNLIEMTAKNSNDEIKSVKQNSDLYWVNENGDGILIQCVIP